MNLMTLPGISIIQTRPLDGHGLLICRSSRSGLLASRHAIMRSTTSQENVGARPRLSACRGCMPTTALRGERGSRHDWRAKSREIRLGVEPVARAEEPTVR
jgi:hypothetical protein